MSSDLERWRREIDRIDDALVELLVERLQTVERVAEAKRSSAAGVVRPAREAAILRRLLARAGGRFPAVTLVRMWRELLAATVRTQSPLLVALGDPSVEETARDHFGAVTDLRSARDGAHALTLVRSGEAHLAVLPLPRGEDRWWSRLAEAGELSVVARLPFLARDGLPGAFVVGRLAPEPSGDDVSLLTVDTRPGGAGRALAGIALAGLDPRLLATAAAGPDRERHLVELRGFLDGDGPLLDGGLTGRPERSQDARARTRVVGLYPRPLDAADLP